jgi:hypothetical protein
VAEGLDNLHSKARDDNARLTATLDRVRALHTRALPRGLGQVPSCVECRVPWPCRTAALDGPAPVDPDEREGQ